MSSLFNQRSRIEGLAAQQAAETKASKITNRHEQPRHAITTANRAEVNDQMWNRMVQTLPSTEDPAGVHYANTGTCSGRDCAATITGRTSSTGGAMAFSAALNSINASQPATVDSGVPAYGSTNAPGMGEEGRSYAVLRWSSSREGLPRGQKVQAQSPAPSPAEGASVLPPSAVRRPPCGIGGRVMPSPMPYSAKSSRGHSLRQPVDLPQYSVPSGQTVNEPRAGPPAWC